MIQSFDPLLVGLSLLFAIVGAWASLRVAARARHAGAPDGWRLLAGCVLGAALLVTHIIAARALGLPLPYSGAGTAGAVAIALGAGMGAWLLLRPSPPALAGHAAAALLLASVMPGMQFVAVPAAAGEALPAFAALTIAGTLAMLAALRIATRTTPRPFLAALVVGGAQTALAFAVVLAAAPAPGAGEAVPLRVSLIAATTLLLAATLLLGEAPVTPADGMRPTLRGRIAGVFLVITFLVGAVVLTALHGQVAGAERAAQYEAHHIARAIAIAGGPDSVRTPETLRRYLAQFHERDPRTVYVVDPAQRVVASFDPAQVGGTAREAPVAVIAQVLADGVRRPAASVPASGPPERLLVAPLRAQPTDAGSPVTGALVVEYTDLHDTLVREARASAEHIFAIAIATMLVIALLGSGLAAAIATPIAVLTRSAATLARGNYDVAVPVGTRDEIGTLAAAFNAMARDLRQSHAQLVADHDELEARVAERTAAWQGAANAHRRTADELQTIVDHLPLALAYVDRDLVVRHHNAQFERWTHAPADAIDGRHARDVLGAANFARVEPHLAGVLAGHDVTYERPNVTRDGVEQVVASALVPRREDDGSVVGFYAMVQDVTERQRATDALRQSNAHLSEINQRLRETQEQLLQVEKMASIGQLASGVAHEINNPIGYVYSNLGTLDKYFEGLLALLERYAAAEAKIDDPATRDELARAKQAADIEFVRQDLVALLAESREGITRVKKIVQDLRNFSRTASDEPWQPADLVAGIESTLNIVWNELKYKAEVVRDFAPLPPVECRPSQLNQVFMNLLVNAAQAIRERGTIRIATGVAGEHAWVEVSDTGEGILPEHLSRVFDPFFTTKAVGQGTGLGLSLSYRIVDEHHGRIEVESEVGVGTRFRVWLPIRQPQGGAA